MGDLVAFCLPDFTKCAPAINDIIPAAKEAIEHFLSLAWLDAQCTGSKPSAQDPFFACWTNIPLCIGVMCVPCCGCAVYLRNMEKMTGKSCESNCLTCCVLNLLCYANICYYAKKRTALRKKYGITGSPCFDCFGCCCFSACLLCQDTNDLQAAGGYSVPYCSAKDAADMKAKVTPSN